MKQLQQKESTNRKARGDHIPPARVAYGNAVRPHFETCMPAFAKGIWKTNAMRLLMGEQPQGEVLELPLNSLYLPPNITAHEFTDAQQPAYVAYKARVGGGAGVDGFSSARFCENT